MPVIKIKSARFGVSEALALYLIRSIDGYKHQQITIIEPFSNDGFCITIRYGCEEDDKIEMDINMKKRKATLNEFLGVQGYNQQLSCAGIVYAEIGHLILCNEMPSRYSGQNVSKIEKNLNHDFRKIYEFFIEIVDVFTQGNAEHYGYMTSEKMQLLQFLKEIDNEIQCFDGNRFTESVELISYEIGKRFQKTLKWYENFYLPAFQSLVDSIKTNVSFNDLLTRASSNLYLPRLIIRPIDVKYRLEMVKLVHPNLRFPQEWVGKEEHIYNLLGLSDIEYISATREFAIAKHSDAAKRLAFELIEYARKRPEFTITGQDRPNYGTSNANERTRPIYSLPSTRENSSENKTAEKEQITNIKNGINQSELEENIEEKAQKYNDDQKIEAENVLDDENGQFENNLVDANGEEIKEMQSDNISNDDKNTNTTTMTAINSLEDTKNNSATEETFFSSRPNSFGCEQLMDLIQKQQKKEENQFCSNVPEQNQNSTTSAEAKQQNVNNNFGGYAEKEEEEEESVDLQVEKVFRFMNMDNSIAFMGVPDKNFTMSHILAAIIVTYAFGNSEVTLRMQGLSKPNSVIRIGPGVYDFEDAKHKFTCARSASLFSFDICLCERRLSAAGIAFILYGKHAIAKIMAELIPEKLNPILMDKNGKKKIAAIFRRTHKRLIQPTDEFVENQQIKTTEFSIFHQLLQETIAKASSDELDGEQGFSCFLTVFYVAMDIFAKFILSQI